MAEGCWVGASLGFLGFLLGRVSRVDGVSTSEVNSPSDSPASVAGSGGVLEGTRGGSGGVVEGPRDTSREPSLVEGVASSNWKKIAWIDEILINLYIVHLCVLIYSYIFVQCNIH